MAIAPPLLDAEIAIHTDEVTPKVITLRQRMSTNWKITGSAGLKQKERFRVLVWVVPVRNRRALARESEKGPVLRWS